MSQHLLSVHQDYSRLTALRQAAGPGITISGHGLTIPDLVAVSRYHAPCEVSTDAAVRQRVEAAVSFINKAIQPGAKTSIYGVTTGFGASAGLRTNQAQSLQLTFLWGLICGIRPDPDGADDPRTKDFDITWDDSSLVFPEPWAKGSIVLRLNSILRGQSGCSWQLIEKLHSLLVYNITPCPPLRQSISASGDLAPLGYVAATLSDDFNVPVWSGKGKDRKRISSRQARRDHGLGSHTFGPKEALATVNGTGASCAVAALALHDTNILALAAQVTSVMAVEALRGTPENFDFITHDVARPHPGQVEVARNCRALLEGSQLARLHDESDPTQALRQDRYDLRAVPQWIGPQLEELLTSRKTIELEMNCTTDNPILDVEGERGVTGANFMATSVSTVMDKTRIGLNHFGKIAFSQFGQLTNPAMSRGLPVDVAAFEPSLDMGLKIADIAMAAYYSELSFVCNTLTNHVQSAEQHNQSVNSMALASARLTYDAIQILYMIYSTFLVALCQAIDIRGLIARFLERLEAELHRSIAPLFDGKDDVQHAALTKKLFIQSRLYFDQSSAKDSTFRFQDVLRPLVADIVAFQATHKTPSSASFDVTAWHANLAETLGELYRATRLEYFENGSADHLMGRTKVVYLFIRKTLKVPIHKGDHKDAEGWDAKFSRVYRSFESGAIIPVLLEAMQLNDVNGSNGAGTNRTHLAKM